MNFGGDATQPRTLGHEAPGAVLGICRHSRCGTKGEGDDRDNNSLQTGNH